MAAFSILELVGAAKFLAVLAVLIGASVMDLRYRRIPDRFWFLMLAGGGPMLVWEMAVKGGLDEPATFLSLLLPIGGFLFIIYGYPEPSKALKGSREDILFFLIYTGSIAGGILAFLLGDRTIVADVGITMIFIIIYFLMYTVPLAGARLLHGGADAKCMVALAVLFPWYIGGLPLQFGPYFSTLQDIPAIGRIFPVHLSILFNAAVVTAVLVMIYIPVRNIMNGEFSLSSFTTYRMDIDKVEKAHVWLVFNVKGKSEKRDPTGKLVAALKRKGARKVKVSPKLPFIVFLGIGTVVQYIVGNLMIALFLLF
ncbi:MAG: hypothetical protein ACMUIE_02855 [Thermoplasmatota archaeon]